MRLRKKRWARPELEQDAKVIFTPAKHFGKWKDVFGNNNQIHLELGCGRGKFITELAAQNPNINYIAIDIYAELLVYVTRKCNLRKLENLRIIPMRIDAIADVFAQDEIERIYINFCNPWLKKAHNKRRLTHPIFLVKYQMFLKKDSEIWFKTDDAELFEDSLEYFQLTGFEQVLTEKIRKEMGNIRTEYEEKFISQGIPIRSMIFRNRTRKNLCADRYQTAVAVSQQGWINSD